MWYAMALTLLAGYLLGNLNGAVNMSVTHDHDDVRRHGSGNAGLTNFVRSFGMGRAVWVLLIDGGKTVLSCLLGGLLLRPYGLEMEGMMLGAVAASLGHDFPAVLGFQGGKGIVCGAAAAAVMDWRIFLVLITVFFITYLITHYVSVGSMLGAVGFAVGFAALHWDRPWVAAGGVFIGALAVLMHRDNLKRLLAGEERKSWFFGKGSQK